jgi:hypothetical protein
MHYHSDNGTRSKFPAAFAANVDPDLTGFIGDPQSPWGMQVTPGEGDRCGAAIQTERASHFTEIDGGKQSQEDFVLRSLKAIEGAESVVLIVRGKHSDDITWFASETSTLSIIGMLELTKVCVYRFAEEQPKG